MDVEHAVIIGKCYVLYKSSHLLIWKTAKKKLLSQYEFRRSIVLDWFGLTDNDSVEGTSEKNSENSRKRTRSSNDFSLSLEEASSSKRATRVTEQTLDPRDGALRVRLDEHAEHYPILSKAKHPCCSLCRLVSPNKNLRVYHHVYSCDRCSVHSILFQALKN